METIYGPHIASGKALAYKPILKKIRLEKEELEYKKSYLAG